MPCHHAMGAFTADGQRGSQHMTEPGLQYLVGQAVVDGQPDADLGNLNIAHDAIARDVEQLPVFIVGRGIGLGAAEGIGEAQLQRLVVLPGGSFGLGIIFGRKLLHRFLVIAYQLVLPKLVPQIADRRVQQNAQTQNEDEGRHQEARCLPPFRFVQGLSQSSSPSYAC